MTGSDSRHVRLSWLIGLILSVVLCLAYAGFFVQRHHPRPQEIVAPASPPGDAAVSHVASTPAPSDQQPAVSTTENAKEGDVVAPPQTSPSVTSEPKPRPLPVTAIEDEPWSVALSQNTTRSTANSPKLTEDFKSAGHDEFPESEAKRWFAPVDGHAFRWSTDLAGQPIRRIARFDGLGKLRAPWRDDAVLRITPFDVTDLTIYFWQGRKGIAFRYDTDHNPPILAAFEITREGLSPKPIRWGMLTTDNGAYTRSTPGMVDLRQQGDDLVLARGGVILMSVPFSGPPAEVLVEGRFRLRGVSMFRCDPYPDRSETSHLLRESDLTAKLPWTVSPDDVAKLTTNHDGSVSLTVDSRTNSGFISIPMKSAIESPQPSSVTGPFEVMIKVESAEPGTGFFLGDREGRPVYCFEFISNNMAQQNPLTLIRSGKPFPDANLRAEEIPHPSLATAIWLKLVAGFETVDVQTSADGRHWGHFAENPVTDNSRVVSSLGLYGLSGLGPKTIRVRQVQVRELVGITSLADPTLRPNVAQFTAAELRDMAFWKQRVDQSRPMGADERSWIATNAVVALSQGPSKQVGMAMVRQLVAIGMKSTRSFSQKCQMLDDVCLLCNLFDEATAKSMAECYEELGGQLARSGDPDALQKLRSAWLCSPIWTKATIPSICVRLHSHEILQAVYRRDWSTAWSLAQSVAYWNQLPNPDFRPTDTTEILERHAIWTKSLVAEFAPRLDDGSARVMPVSLRHPLVSVFNKEAYNLRAELQSALSAGNYSDACQAAISIDSSDAQGLLPDQDDRDLFVTLLTAISIARKAYPDFATTMADKFGPQGVIRVRSAINRHNITGVQAATLQFIGTDAARDAHQWLGDTNLAVGRFEVAEQHFRDALINASQQRRDFLQPRLLLSLALGGRLSHSQLTDEFNQVKSNQIEFNKTIISATEFRSILDNLISSVATTGLLNEPIQTQPPPLPRSECTLKFRAEFDGHPGNNFGRWEFRFGDPIGRQLSVASDDRHFYVSNRFQVNAYSADSGRQIWAQGLGSEQGEAYSLPFTPMRPVLAEDRLFVRRLTKAGVELACLNADDGEIIWHRRPSFGVLTDPVIWNGRLFTMLLTKLEDDQVQVEAAWLDPGTGNVTSSRPLFRIRESSEQQDSGQLTILDRIAVCTVAGVTASFDWQGEMRWLRRHILMRKPVDELAEDVRVSLPVIKHGRVITTMPGVREVCCLDVDTGRTIWNRSITNLRGLLGTTDTRIVVDTVTGLEALDIESGIVVWRYPMESRLEACIIQESTLLVTDRRTTPDKGSIPVFVWLDSNSGREAAQKVADIAEREEFQLGPMFSAGGKWWTFVGQTWKNPKRELHEFATHH